MARNATTHKSTSTRPPHARRTSGRTPVLTLALALDPAEHQPLQRQLYGALRTAILEGRLGAGGRLPSSRQLAGQLEISRTTVALVYDQLRAEGYLEGRERSGTFVAPALPEELLYARATAVPSRKTPLSSLGDLSARGTLLASLSVTSSPLYGGNGARAFRLGTPALDQFPFALWGRLLGRRWRRLTAAQLSYAEPNGYAPLRSAIAEYARQARAVSCDASQVIVVSGAQQAFDIVARVLLDPGDAACVENPGYRGVQAALVAAGATIVPLSVDADGLDVTSLRARTPAPRLACVTPAHQFPLGVTLSAPRRLALLEWARAHSAWIVEDDFDSEYRFRGRPLPSLQGMDEHDRVIYVGTFSKTLFPALRLGYLIVPARLVDTFARARAVIDRHPSALEQAVLADFIVEGHFARHVRRMRALYAERQDILLELVAQRLGEWIEASRVDAGMHLVGWLRTRMDDQRVSKRALALGVVASALSALSVGPFARGALLLGFAGYTRVDMRLAADQLSVALHEEHARLFARRGPRR